MKRRAAISHKIKKIILVAVFLLIMVAAGLLVWRSIQQAPLQKPSTVLNKPPVKQEKTTIRLIASGDLIAHDSINQQAKTATGYDYSPYFRHVKEVFDKADIRFCNEEIPVASPALGNPTGYPVFNAPKEFARDISGAGCNVINTATNHANDKLQPGIDETLNVWDGLPKLAIAGMNRSAEEQDKINYFTVKGKKFAFLAYNYMNNNKNLAPQSVNMFDETLMSTQIRQARQKGATIIVSMHWGTEDSPLIDSAQDRWSQFLAEQGADIVIGTGPHVLQPVKKLPKQGGGETLIWYSVGNLLSTQLKIEELIGGFAVMDFEIDSTEVSLKDIGFLPTYMHYEWTPGQAVAQDLLARKNINLYLLEDAAESLARSNNQTTIEAQRDRIKAILNTYITVPILTSETYGL